MNDIVNPVFGNSCGRLYLNKVIITNKGRQKEYSLDNIKSVALRSRPKITGLLFVMLPLCLLPLPLLIHDEGAVIKISLFVMALFLAILAYIKMEWHYSLLFRLKTGANYTVKVPQVNVMEARKFARVVMSCLKSN